jgi:hypothetical protein
MAVFNRRSDPKALSKRFTSLPQVRAASRTVLFCSCEMLPLGRDDAPRCPYRSPLLDLSLAEGVTRLSRRNLGEGGSLIIFRVSGLTRH